MSRVAVEPSEIHLVLRFYVVAHRAVVAPAMEQAVQRGWELHGLGYFFGRVSLVGQMQGLVVQVTV